ncbi:hypothetical protein SAMN03084138_03905 [Enterovibrio norvegicus DSM 15893]|uniref:Uncharacterized protein n=2 Tax=Enterovibrio norvegicus TaxID=188144 RepID=A0A1I5VED7_9GAMM|nr:hypothetical protein SAMN03084138_03905 [Enterovibrio norvegicus DSM 15893]
MASMIPSAADIKNFKRLAKQQKRILQCSHMQALEFVARQHGYDSWHQVLKIADQGILFQIPDDTTNAQRVLLDNPLYSSVPVGWLIGRKPYPDFALRQDDCALPDKMTELEVPSSRWQAEKKV